MVAHQRHGPDPPHPHRRIAQAQGALHDRQTSDGHRNRIRGIPEHPGPLQPGATVLRRGERRRGQPQQIHPLGLPAGGPGQRRARHPTRTCRRPTGHAHRRPTTQHHQRDRPQRWPRLRGPRPSRILGTGNHRPVRSGPIRPRRRPHHAGRHRTRPHTDRRPHRPASQQCGRQGLLLGRARELYDGPLSAI